MFEVYGGFTTPQQHKGVNYYANNKTALHDNKSGIVD
jgi:hypothetical protein